MNPYVLSFKDSIVVTFLSSFLIWLILGGLLGLWIIDGRIKKEQALHAFLSALFAWLVTEMIKNLFPFPRPFEVNHHLPQTLTIPFDGSFPSAHAAVSFAVALSVFLHDKKLGLLFIAGAVFVGLGRLISNVHYFQDVLVGGLIGISSSYILDKMHVYKIIE